jgi:hypothetical protein
MLSKDGEIFAMSAVRKQDIVPQSTKAMGEKEAIYVRCFATICNIVYNVIFGSQALLQNFYVGESRVKIEKDKVDSSKVKYLSTNDVLTSQFGIVTSARVLWMALNYRERLPDFNNNDAG